ncbi:MAG TPA: hypothetical protein IAB31_04845 [Candidatus Choladousia intestinavium]|uniref:Uncharacterized protein n=1 Tax=Candidatus Choladousia intestinavium TaxID=2840727 RepID=A0A9D1AC40_9FIRM|nr:hypothetical protein [Candidatus Choladousia intestinavium]
MGKLMKYEFRKTMFSKAVLLVITALVEIFYLFGVFLKWEKGLGIGVLGLVLCASVGIFYIGIESLLIWHRDLNTKQSYMLFLTPRNSFQILGAKVLENGISLFLAGVFFALLAAADWTIGMIYIGGLEEFVDLLQNFAASINVNLEIPVREILVTFFACIASWLLMVVTGYFAILLSASVLAGKKFSGFVSFVLYMILMWVDGMFLDLVPALKDFTIQYVLIILAALLLSAVYYFVSGWIMEKKLSV